MSVRGCVVPKMERPRAPVIHGDHRPDLRKDNRFEKRHESRFAPLSPCFTDVQVGDTITVAGGPPLSKTVPLHELQVPEAVGATKPLQKLWEWVAAHCPGQNKVILSRNRGCRSPGKRARSLGTSGCRRPTCFDTGSFAPSKSPGLNSPEARRLPSVFAAGSRKRVEGPWALGDTPVTRDAVAEFPGLHAGTHTAADGFSGCKRSRRLSPPGPPAALCETGASGRRPGDVCVPRKPRHAQGLGHTLAP